MTISFIAYAIIRPLLVVGNRAISCARIIALSHSSSGDSATNLQVTLIALWFILEKIIHNLKLSSYEIEL